MCIYRSVASSAIVLIFQGPCIYAEVKHLARSACKYTFSTAGKLKEQCTQAIAKMQQDACVYSRFVYAFVCVCVCVHGWVLQCFFLPPFLILKVSHPNI